MRLFAGLLREPLIHFLVIGSAVFAVYSVMNGDAPPPREQIVVSEGRLRQIMDVFTQTWQRPPRPEEISGLVEGYVKEEIFYREGVKLGLDRDDTVIRRRLQQKLEFLIEPPEEALKASDVELAAFLAANRGRFHVEPQIAFQQVFISPEKPEPAALRAASMLADLRKPGADAGQHGDPTLLPTEVPLAPLRLIARNFGEDFAAGLAALPPGEWSGPVGSPYGLHLVRVTEAREGYDPPLAEVRAEVLQEWQREQREAYAEESYRQLRDSYDVVLPEAVGGKAGSR